MKAKVLEAWKYGNPADICDGLIAETERLERAEARKAEPAVRERRDKFYTQSKSIGIKALVKRAKRGAFHGQS